MAGLLSKIGAFARSPAGRRALRTATTKAQGLASDPRTKEKVARVRTRFQGRGGQAPAGPSSPVQEAAPDDARGQDDGGPARL